MSYKLGIVGYAPPPHIEAATAFYENLKQFPTKHETILFSDWAWDRVVPLKKSPEEIYKPEQKASWPHKFALNNLLFFQGMMMALKSGMSHVIYLESDCRVGRKHWDDVMFDEFFSLGKNLILGGTVVCYNPCNWNRAASDRWQKLVSENTSKNMPVATYGWKSAQERQSPCVFTNGALSVIDMAWIRELFRFEDGCVSLSEHPCPWDFRLGLEIGERFFEEAYDVVGMLTSVYSSFGDVITSQQDRQDMLTSGKVVAVHQIKDGWKP